MEGYTEIVKLVESALNGDCEKSKVWINKFIEKHPNSEFVKPFKALLIGDKNPDKLRCDGETSDEPSNCNMPLVSRRILDRYVVLLKPNYLAKDGTVKPGILLDRLNDCEYKWLAPKDDLYGG